MDRGESGVVAGGLGALAGRWRGAARRRMTASDKAQSLLDLAGHLQAVLVPVAPGAGFRRRLEDELVAKARRQPEEPEGGLRHRRALLIGAILGSLASVVGVILTVILYNRQNRATRVAVH